ncbi:MAG: hypothetical protein ACTSRP_15235, partial [Candidatus Helarchaeota archaeon]
TSKEKSTSITKIKNDLKIDDKDINFLIEKGFIIKINNNVYLSDFGVDFTLYILNDLIKNIFDKFNYIFQSELKSLKDKSETQFSSYKHDSNKNYSDLIKYSRIEYEKARKSKLVQVCCST